MITFVLIVLQEMILLCDDTTTKMFLKVPNNVVALYENVLNSYISVLCTYVHPVSYEYVYHINQNVWVK